MLNPAIAQAVIDQPVFGADFVDIFVENQKVTEVELLSSKIEKPNTGIDFGIGLRMVGTNVLYGYTNHTEKDELLRVIALLGAQISDSKSNAGISFTDENGGKAPGVTTAFRRHSHGFKSRLPQSNGRSSSCRT